MHGINQTIQVSHLGITLDGIYNGAAGTTQQSGHLNLTITQNGDGIAPPKDEDITSLRESSTGGAVSKMARPQADNITEMEGMNTSVKNLTMEDDAMPHNQSYILVPPCSMTQCGPFTHASPMVGVLHIVIMVVASLLSMAFPTCAIIKLIKQRQLQALKNRAAVTALTQNILQFHNPVYASSDSIGRPPSTVQETDHNHHYEVIPPDVSGQDEPIAAAPVKLTKLIPPIQNAAYHSVTKNTDK
ncbi:hypothetical protein Bbelb_017720 [Branchiostoma belcheri]|nr:hypothetical protein Bbelb_017720 [Branchiostoma belcheri]